MHTDPLHQNQKLYINALLKVLDTTHPAVKTGMAMGADDAELNALLAKELREAVVMAPLLGLRPDHPIGPRIGRKGETLEMMLERCRNNTWISVGKEHTFKNGLDYHWTPGFEDARETGIGYGEWTWQINRHAEWAQLARLYQETGDERIAETVAGWLRTWLIQCPPPSFDLNCQQGPWRTIEIGIRLMDSWPTVLAAFRHAPAFDDALFLAWLGSWACQAYFVWQYRKVRNWLHMELCGLLSASVHLPFLRDAERFRDQAVSTMLVDGIEAQLFPDGLQFELSPSYHGVCIRNSELMAKMLQDAGHEVPVKLSESITAMYEPWRKLARPDKKLWGFQDSTPVLLSTVLTKLPEDQRGPHDSWFIKGEGAPPTQRHSILPYSGYAVLRSSWEPDALCVAFDGGPIGTAHMHEDKLGIQLMAFGTDLIGEAGLVDYDNSPERHYSMSTLAHSTALVDGEGQCRRSLPNARNPDLQQQAGMDWDFKAEVPWVRAAYEEGYGRERQIPVTHQRTVSMIDDRHIVLLDRFSATDQKPHSVEILFHFRVDDVELKGTRVVTRSPNGNLGLNAQSLGETTLTAELVTGGQEPDLRGWSEPDPDPKRGVWILVPRPCLTLKATFENTLEVVTVIQTFEKGSEARSPELQIDEGTVMVGKRHLELH